MTRTRPETLRNGGMKRKVAVRLGCLFLAAVLSGCASSTRNTISRYGAAPSVDPRARSAAEIRMAPAPWTVISSCQQVQAKVTFPVLCPTLIPRPLLGLPGEPPPVLGTQTLRIAGTPTGLDIGYGAPWEADPAGGMTASVVRPHRWRNRPCCFLHFVIQRADRQEGGVPRQARPYRLGNRNGLLLRANGKYFQGPYFGNHVRFFFRAYGVWYAATLHSFGNGPTTTLLGRIVAHLRPTKTLSGPAFAATPSVTLTGSVGARGIATGAGSIWVLDTGDPAHGYSTPQSFTRAALIRINPASGQVVAKISVGKSPRAIAFSAGDIWVAGVHGQKGVVIRVDPISDKVVATLPVGGWPSSIVGSATSVWIVDSAPFFKRGTLLHIDSRTNRRLGVAIRLGLAPSGVAQGAGSVWVADALAGSVQRIDSRTQRRLATIQVGRYPYGVAFGFGSVWVTNTDDATVSRIDPVTNRVIATISVGENPYGIAVEKRDVVVADLGDGTLTRIDPQKNAAIPAAIPVGREPLAVAAGPSGIWITDNSDGIVRHIGSR